MERAPAGHALLGEIAAVAQDLPLLLTAPLYRRWQLRWRATAAEVTAPLPVRLAAPGAQCAGGPGRQGSRS